MTDAEQVALEVLRERGDGEARDHVIDLRDPAVGEHRGQVADVALDDVEVGQAVEPLVEQPGEVGVAFEDDDAALGPAPSRRGPA